MLPHRWRTLAAQFIAVMLIASRPSSAEELKGRVLSPEGKPVSGAVVLHRRSGLKTLTAQDGSFLLHVDAEGRVRLEIIHPDYQEEVIAVPANKGQQPLEVILVPYIRQREEIVVTALRYPEPSMDVPAAGTVLRAEALTEGLSPHLAGGVGALPGVSVLGSGGFSLVPSIRGLTRNRVLFLVDFARISSDRRTGPNASFIAPEDMDRVEVLRSPSSVLYGSDAIGGVFQVFLREPDPRQGIHGRLNARYGSGNEEKGLGAFFSWRRGALGFCLSLQGVDAEEYRNSEGRVPLSGFSQWSLTAKISYRTERRQVDLSLVRSRGVDIGKPARDSLTRPTWYPREHNNLAQIHWLEKGFGGGELSFQAYINPNFLETRTDLWDTYKTRESFSRAESTDFGMQLAFNRPLLSMLRLNMGLDVSGRSGAGTMNTDINFDSEGRESSTFEESPYTKGSRWDVGMFLALDFNGLKNLDIIGGLRWDRLRVEADPGGAGQLVGRKDSALSGFAAASYRLSPQLVLFANVSRAYRAPTIGERFYTGITGRGFIISQPELAAERSLNFDAGLKFAASRAFIGVYGFTYDIDGLIERYLLSERTYTYGNVDKGRIQGGELEAEWFPLNGLKMFGNISLARGRSVLTGQALNDIPPLRLLGGVRIWLGRFSGELAVRRHQDKVDPGPAEIALSSCTLVDLKMNVYLPSSLQLNVMVSNVFDVLFLGRSDPDAPRDPGRNILIGVVYSF